MTVELWLIFLGVVIIAAMVLAEQFRRGIHLSKRYHAAVKFQLGTTRLGFYNPKRVNRMRRASVTPQNAAWLLLNENRRSEDKF